MKKLKDIRQDPRWPNAHVALKRIYEERIRESLSQEEFGRKYGIGTQGMVWQYLNGYTPLNIEVAWKFADGLRCTIRDISPEMDEIIREGLLPVLGLKWRRRVAALVLSILVPHLAVPNDAQAQSVRNESRLCIMLNRLRLWLLSQLGAFRDCPITS